MNIRIAVACECATQQNGRLHILGTFDTIIASSFPYTKPQCAIVLQIEWERHEAGEHDIKVRFSNEDGQQTLHPMSSSINIEFAKEQLVTCTNNVINLQQLKFVKPGIYMAIAEIDNEVVSEISFQVITTENSS